MDWNWFFSSLAQSAAAIVGLFGAFIVTKIVNNEAQFRQKSAHLLELIEISESFRERFYARYFHWYNEHKHKRDMDRIWLTLDDEKPNYRSPERYYEDEGFSPYISKIDIIDQIRETIRLHSTPRATERSGPSLYIPPSILLEQREQAFNQQIDEEGELIKSLTLELRAHVRSLRNFATEISANPESTRLITSAIFAVLAIFFFGVIYPLSFLPTPESPRIDYTIHNFLSQMASIHGGLLFILSTTFTAIMLVFLVINWRLRYPQSKLQELSAWSSLGAYSEYLEILEANERVRETATAVSSAESEKDDENSG